MDNMVSFTWPQEEPARDFRILIRVEALEVMAEMCGEMVKWVLKVTPRILGALSRGMMELLMETWGWTLDWWLSGVKRVTEDFDWGNGEALEGGPVGDEGEVVVQDGCGLMY